MILKVFARLYKYTPEVVLDLTLAQVWSLLPDSVEQEIMNAEGQDKQSEHMAGAVVSLKAKTGRDLFTTEEITEEQWNLYA